MKIIDVVELSTGSRLKELIQDSSSSQKDFIRKFNDWLQDRHPDHPYVTEKDISRWITGKVKPRKSKIQLFAEYFDVDVDFLECKTSTRKKRTVSPVDFKKLHPPVDDQKLREEWKHEERLSCFKAYCETFGFRFEYEPTTGQEVTHQHTFVDNGVQYTVELTEQEGTDPDLVIVFPDGEKITCTDQAFNNLVQNCDNMVEFEFSKIRKKGREQNAESD